MGPSVSADNPADLIAFLREHPAEAIRQEDTAIYAVQPAGPFAHETYVAMFDALTSSLDSGGVEQRVSIPGFISGSTRLWNGLTVPVICPDLRGIPLHGCNSVLPICYRNGCEGLSGAWTLA
jgi:hypothetical protein